MARPYRMTFVRRLVNWIIRTLLQLGLAPPGTYLLTTRGRKSGQLHSTPVTVVEENGQRWLVSPYGEVGWVYNARAVGQVALSRGRQSETVQVQELGPVESAPVLQKYLTNVRIVQPFFDVTPTSPLEAFAAEASRHPVFRIGEPIRA